MMIRSIRILTFTSFIVMAASVASAEVSAPQKSTEEKSKKEVIKEKLKEAVKKAVVKEAKKAVEKLEAKWAPTPVAKGDSGEAVARRPSAATGHFISSSPQGKTLIQRTPLTQTFYTKTALSLCDVVVPVPDRYGPRSYDANAAMRRCRADIGRYDARADVTKKDLYEMTLRICSGHAMQNDARKFACYSRAQSLMPYDSTLNELKICGLSRRFDSAGKVIVPFLAKKSEIVSCVEDQMQCSAAFPVLKDGLRERGVTVAKLQKSLRVSHLDAEERWGVLSTSEVTADNVETARACLLKTMNAYARVRRPSQKTASVRDSVQLLISELHMTFPEATTTSTRPENHFDVVR